MAFIMLFLNLTDKNHPDVMYVIYAVLVLYDAYHLYRYIFGYRPIEQILFVLGEVILILLFTSFRFWPEGVQKYNLDFFAILVTLVIEVFAISIRINFRCQYGNEDLGLQLTRDTQRTKAVLKAERRKERRSIEKAVQEREAERKISVTILRPALSGELS
jgi:hypothetical protein